MTPQEAVDFVHQCRQCRPDTLSCTQALTLEAHTRWKLKFTKVLLLQLLSLLLLHQVAPAYLLSVCGILHLFASASIVNDALRRQL